MNDWGNFYLTIGTAAATLTGLMFIALTFGSKLVTPDSVDVARSILSPIFFHFAHAFVMATMALVPDEGMEALALSAIVLSALRIALLPHLMKKMKREQEERGEIEQSDWILEVYIPFVIYLAMIIAGGIVLHGDHSFWPLTTIGVLTMSLVILGAFTAWDLLVWMASKIEN